MVAPSRWWTSRRGVARGWLAAGAASGVLIGWVLQAARESAIDGNADSLIEPGPSGKALTRPGAAGSGHRTQAVQGVLPGRMLSPPDRGPAPGPGPGHRPAAGAETPRRRPRRPVTARRVRPAAPEAGSSGVRAARGH